MRRFNSLILLVMFALPICTSPVIYRIEISPNITNGIFEIGLNTTVTFNATGYEKNEDTTIETTVQIDKVWWNFDKEILTKVNSNAPNSITLKAVKSGVSNLTAIGMVKNQSCTKTITILVKDKVKLEEALTPLTTQ